MSQTRRFGSGWPRTLVRGLTLLSITAGSLLAQDDAPDDPLYKAMSWRNFGVRGHKP